MMMMTEMLSLTCDRLMSHRQLACCASHCCIPLNCKELLIYSNPNTSKKPLLLTGHHGDISAMVFGTGKDPVLLCSASADYIIVWDIERCQKRAAEGRIAAGTIIGTSLGEVDYLAFSLSDQRIAACSRNTVYILSSKKEDVMCTLTGHLGPLTCAEFCPWNIDILVTTSEDRTFKVWDLTTECVYYQSFVLSASPLLSVCFLEDSRQLITGSSEGQVWCFSLPDDHKCHLVTRMDLQKMQKRLERQLDTAAANRPGGVTGVMQEQQTHSDIVETSKPVLRMSFCSSLTGTRDMEKNRRNGCLWIGSSDGLYLVDLATSDLLAVIYFKEFPKVSISMAGSWSISPGRQNSTVCLVSSMFAPCVVLLEVQMPDSVDGLRDLLRPNWTGGEDLTVVPSAPPLLESPLHAAFKQKEPTKKGGVREQPLVFHSNVRSSGYTSSPRRNMFSPKTNIQKTSHTTKTNKKIGWKLRDYPANSTAPSVPHTKLSIAKKPVCCFQYSGNGKHILCGLGDGSVLLYKSSLTGKPAVYTGHGKAVSSVGWSHSRQWWLSASEDQTLQIWPCDNAEPVISMSADKFSKPIKAAQLYYLDKFLLMASGPSLYLYLCHLDRTRDDIKRYQQRSVLKLVRCLETPATEITAMSAINDFFSYIVLACGSDRSIQVFDMNKGAVASEVSDAHSRAIHCITQNKGSMFSTQAPDSYNLFLTSAVTDGVKLWDLRTLRCVRRYESHVNRCYPCGSAISPCGRFIASGSEDNCAYVYDIGSSSYIHKLQRHSDTVLNVTFNPAMPELLTGTLDGELSVFHPSTGTSLSPESCA